MKDLGRRGFLSLFGLGAAGLAFAPDLPKFLVYEPAKLGLMNGDSVNIAAITDAFTDELHRMVGPAIRSVNLPDDTSHKLGDRVRAVMLDAQRNVSFNLSPGSEYDLRARFIAPGAEALAWRIKTDRLNVFGNPGLVPGSKIKGHLSRRNGLAVRGLLLHDDLAEIDYFRFDIIGGHA